VGYLGGRWDINNQSGYWAWVDKGVTGAGLMASCWYPTVLTVLRAFPCRSRLGDTDTAATVEEEVRAWGLGGRTVAMFCKC
jgi:hypothetical protein